MERFMILAGSVLLGFGMNWMVGLAMWMIGMALINAVIKTAGVTANNLIKVNNNLVGDKKTTKLLDF